MHMDTVYPKIHLRENWSMYGSTYVCGSAYIHGILLEKDRLAHYFDAITHEDMIEALRRINGFFSIIKVDNEFNVFIAADRIRSIPVFYTSRNMAAYISDDPYWIHEQLADGPYDELSRYEFLLTRYVTGPYTLSSAVRQIQAGEAVIFKNSSDTDNYPVSIRYFMYDHVKYTGRTKEELLKMHETVLDSAFKRLIKWADNRLIVVPLSGGYDSRLIILMLKKLNYGNILAFSFGKPDNPEEKISRQVAGNLGVRWEFIPYDNPGMYGWTNSKEWHDFNRMADGLCTVCLDREWPAVWELKKQGRIPADSIFVPGHSGDFTAGGHIPAIYADNSFISEEEFVRIIFRTHYTMWNWMGERENLQIRFKNRIFECIGKDNGVDKRFTACDYEKWVWQEFEAKYLVNAVRVYEFWGFKWWLPLWDAEYVDFWRSVPVEWRIQKRLYTEHIARLYSELAGITIREAMLRNDTPGFYSSLLAKLKSRVKKTPVISLVRAVKNRIRYGGMVLPSVEYPENDWEQSLGRMNSSLYRKLLQFMTSRSSCTTLEKLGYIRYTDDDVPGDTIALLQRLKGKH